MKILNLYAGIGGNRKLWGNKHKITAVEIDPKIAKIYKKFFPEDKIIIGDAHNYLLKHFKKFDLIWSSPPCPTHSITNWFLHKQGKIRYPNMKLYEEIIFLKAFFKGKWVVENVKPYYEPLIKGQEIGRHLFWANFNIPKITLQADIIETSKIKRLEANKGFNLDFAKGLGKRKDQILRNCVNAKLGNHILKCAFKDKQEKLI